MEPGETANIDRPEIERRLAGHDPFGQRHACAARARDAHRIEAGADEEALELRRLAQDVVEVGRKLSGPFMKVLMPVFSSAGTRISALSIRIWNWSQSSGSMPNSKSSGMTSLFHG